MTHKLGGNTCHLSWFQLKSISTRLELEMFEDGSLSPCNIVRRGKKYLRDDILRKSSSSFSTNEFDLSRRASNWGQPQSFDKVEAWLERLLLGKSNNVKLVKCPRDIGIAPTNWYDERSNMVKDLHVPRASSINTCQRMCWKLQNPEHATLILYARDIGFNTA